MFAFRHWFLEMILLVYFHLHMSIQDPVDLRIQRECVSFEIFHNNFGVFFLLEYFRSNCRNEFCSSSKACSSQIVV